MTLSIVVFYLLFLFLVVRLLDIYCCKWGPIIDLLADNKRFDILFFVARTSTYNLTKCTFTEVIAAHR